VIERKCAHVSLHHAHNVAFQISYPQNNYEIYELIPVLLLGVIGGLLGSSFISINSKLALWRKEHIFKYGPRARMIEGLLISLLTSGVSFLLPLMFSCQVRGLHNHTHTHTHTQTHTQHTHTHAHTYIHTHAHMGVWLWYVGLYVVWLVFDLLSPCLLLNRLDILLT
jgi:H+/Cl- antiporter ClcA